MSQCLHCWLHVNTLCISLSIYLYLYAFLLHLLSHWCLWQDGLMTIKWKGLIQEGSSKCRSISVWDGNVWISDYPTAHITHFKICSSHTETALVFSSYLANWDIQMLMSSQYDKYWKYYLFALTYGSLANAN